MPQAHLNLTPSICKQIIAMLRTKMLTSLLSSACSCTWCVKEIIFSFLIVGHTHEDIDQLFSTVQTKFHSASVHTPAYVSTSLCWRKCGTGNPGSPTTCMASLVMQHPMSSTSTRMLRGNQRCRTSHTTARVSGQCPTSCWVHSLFLPTTTLTPTTLLSNFSWLQSQPFSPGVPWTLPPLAKRCTYNHVMIDNKVYSLFLGHQDTTLANQALMLQHKQVHGLPCTPIQYYTHHLTTYTYMAHTHPHSVCWLISALSWLHMHMQLYTIWYLIFIFHSTSSMVVMPPTQPQFICPQSWPRSTSFGNTLMYFMHNYSPLANWSALATSARCSMGTQAHQIPSLLRAQSVQYLHFNKWYTCQSANELQW